MSLAFLSRRSLPAWAFIVPLAAAGLWLGVVAWGPALWGPHIETALAEPAEAAHAHAVPWMTILFMTVAAMGAGIVALILDRYKTALEPLSLQSCKVSLDVVVEAGQLLDAEAQKIAALLAVSANSHEDYADCLGGLQDRISAVETPDELRAIATLLAAENHRMRIGTRQLARELDASRSQIDTLRSSLNEAIEEGQRDPLTEIGNRRAFDLALNNEGAAAAADHRPLSVVVVDIDSFKTINDTFGHQAGDAVLKSFAKVLADTARPQDTVARLGGEEFAILQPDTSSMAAAVLAERLRAQVEAKLFDVADARQLRITASMGVAQLRAGENTDDLMRRADERLYRAKNLGRNRVVTV